MKSTQVDEDSFSILSDAGDMIGGVLVVGRKTVDVVPAGSYSGFDILPSMTNELREFAEAEARRLGMLDD